MSNYLKKTEKTGKSVEEALELALAELGADESDVEYTVLEEPAKGFLGIGSKDAVVSVQLKDSVLFTAKKFLGNVFDAMNLDVGIDAVRADDCVNIDLSGDNMGIIIGKRGDTLDSLQYLTSLVANKDRNSEYTRISIDTEGYREKRVESLKALSNRLADKVAKSGKKYTLEPMNPYERRIIHANLQDSEDVTTFSIGEEPHRKVVIAPKHERRRSSGKKSAPRHTYTIDEDLPKTYPGGGQPKFNKAKASSFEEYLAEHEND